MNFAWRLSFGESPRPKENAKRAENQGKKAPGNKNRPPKKSGDDD
jgi:hypothetical protein